MKLESVVKHIIQTKNSKTATQLILSALGFLLNIVRVE